MREETVIMNFTTAVSTCLRNYVGFSGRARRSEYWYFYLFTIGVAVVAAILDAVIVPGSQSQPIETVTSLALLLPSIAVGVRRLHDIDRTGWWLLIVFTIIGIFVLLYWACVKGTDGANRFGSDPLQQM